MEEKSKGLTERKIEESGNEELKEKVKEEKELEAINEEETEGEERKPEEAINERIEENATEEEKLELANEKEIEENEKEKELVGEAEFDEVLSEEKKENEIEEKFYQIKPERIEEMKKIIEASFFMSPDSLSVEEISKAIHCTRFGLIERIIAGLIEEYKERDSALEIVKELNGYKMQVKREFEEKISHLAASTEFNKGIMKTLAFIAFKQPVKQSLVIKFRTNKAYEEIKLLEEKGFVSKEKSGLTYIVRTTKKFLDYFGENAVKLKENPEFYRE